MRTFSLFALLLLVSALSSVQASPLTNNKVLNSADFFTVVFPYDEAVQQAAAENGLDEKGARNSALNTMIGRGMNVLLVRLTGQKAFLMTETGQDFLSRPRAWLRTYDITPRVEEGVQVGQNIVLRYSERKIRKTLKAAEVSIWPIKSRSTTLVMGSLVQKGELLKLTQENMRYRLDVEFRDDAKLMMLPISLPESTSRWVFPVASSSVVDRVQETLARTDHDYLLSFKLITKGPSKQVLVWNVYSDAGDIILHGQFDGDNRQALMLGMFEQVMARYVEIDSEQSLSVNQFILNVHSVFDTKQIQAFEELFRKQVPMIRSSQLLSVQAGTAQFKVTYQGERRKLLKWILSWEQANLIQDMPDLGMIDVKINLDYFRQAPEIDPEEALATELEQITQGVQ